MTGINDNEVNNKDKCNLIHYILNNPKRTKESNSRYYPILNVCTNTRNGRSKFKNFRILLDSGRSYTIVIGRLVENTS